jgi:prefoldin subunit 5
MIMAELASTLANHWPELLLGLILLYASIALLLAILVYIGGRLQARTKTAIERLSAKIAELAESSADLRRSTSAGASSMERLSAKIDQLADHAVATAQPEGQITIGADVKTAIERLTEQFAAHPAESASHHYALDEIKAAIDTLTMKVQQLTASIQKIQKPTAEIERWRRGIQHELPDVLKKLKTPPDGAR